PGRGRGTARPRGRWSAGPRPPRPERSGRPSRQAGNPVGRTSHNRPARPRRTPACRRNPTPAAPARPTPLSPGRGHRPREPPWRRPGPAPRTRTAGTAAAGPPAYPGSGSPAVVTSRSRLPQSESTSRNRTPPAEPRQIMAGLRLGAGGDGGFSGRGGAAGGRLQRWRTAALAPCAAGGCEASLRVGWERIGTIGGSASDRGGSELVSGSGTSLDDYADRCAQRERGRTASEIRALFAVA